MEPVSKYQEDKRTILSVIKYAMIIVISAAVLFFGFKVIWIILPVLLGFVIAYTATLLSNGLYRLFVRRIPVPGADGQDRKGFKILKLFIYFLLLLTFIGFLILVIIALIAQIRNLISFIENNADSFDFIRRFSDNLIGLSDKLGGFLPDSAITRITVELEKEIGRAHV